MDIKTQAATEYLMIMGFVMVLLVPSIYLYVTYSSNSQDSIIVAKVDAITNEIVKATEQVYSYGAGSQTTLTIDIPKSVKLIEFSNGEIIFTIVNSKGQESEIAKFTNINIEGNITIIPGIKKINLVSLGNSVSIYVECSSGNRCGSEWECQYYGNINSCTMDCTNNQWAMDDRCPNGCTDGECNDGGQQGGECFMDQTCIDLNHGKPWCISPDCEECEFDNHCAQGEVCNENNICVVEVECTTDGDCTNPSFPACNTESGLCVPCVNNAHCDEGQGEICTDNQCGLQAGWCNVDGDCLGNEGSDVCISNACEVYVCTTGGDDICDITPNCAGDPSCIKSCSNNAWSIIQTCIDGTPACNSGPPPICVACNGGDLKCGDPFIECNLWDTCTMDCQNNQWALQNDCGAAGCDGGICNS